MGWLVGGLRRKSLLQKLTGEVAEVTRQLGSKEIQIVRLRAAADSESRRRNALEQQIAGMTEVKQRENKERSRWMEEKKRQTNEEEQLRRNEQKQRQKKDAEELEAERKENIGDPDNQLRFVEAANLKPRAILNDHEKEVFKAALEVIRVANAHSSRGYSLAIQVSMGEFLGTPDYLTQNEQDSKGYRSINSKRVDFLIYFKKDFIPALVIEYHGPGHFQGNWEKRDAVKRAAFKKAGIPVLETKSTNPKTLEQQITSMLPS